MATLPAAPMEAHEPAAYSPLQASLLAWHRLRLGLGLTLSLSLTLTLTLILTLTLTLTLTLHT